MNFKEKIIEFLICTIIIMASIKFMLYSFDIYIPKQENISSGIIIEKIHNKAYTDTIFLTDANGITTFYTNYYDEYFIFKITEKNISSSLIVGKNDYEKYKIGDRYSK